MEVAEQLLHACETGAGWEKCRKYCTHDAKFNVQAVDAVPGTQVTRCKTIEDYTDWMKAVVEGMGEAASYKVHAAAQTSKTFP